MTLYQSGFLNVNLREGEAMDDTSASTLKEDANNSRLFAFAFALLSLICIISGALYVNYYILNMSSIINIMPEISPERPRDTDFQIFRISIIIFERFFPLLLIAFFALSFTKASIAFVKSSDYSRTGVVPPRDLPMIAEAIKQGKPEAVDQYIRLASLTGSVGLFQKIGLTGLPLTTLVLVIFFAFGVLLSSDNSETFKAFLDFTKLTLGAFIGSFVQRQVERRGQESELQKALSLAKENPTTSQQPAPNSQPSPPNPL